MTTPTKLTIIYDNPIDDALSITAASELPTMPVSLLRTMQRSEVYRSTGCASEWIKVAFSRPVRADYIGLVNHNLTTGVQFRAQLNIVDDFSGTTPVDETLPLKTFTYGVGDQPFGRYGFGGTVGLSSTGLVTRPVSPPQSLFFTAATDAMLYALFSILDPLNTAGFIQIGRLYCAKSLTFSRNYSWGSALDCIDSSTIISTPDGHDWPDKHAKIFQRSINIGNITSDERFYELMDFWLMVGITDPFILILDPSTEESRRLTSHYCRLVEDPRITDAYVNKHDIVLKIREVR